MRFPVVVVLLCAAGSTIGAERVLAGEKMPQEARQVILQVAEAALRRNWAELRRQMVDEFTWDFGGEASADEAIVEWKVDPKPLSEFAKRLSKRCRLVEAGRIECPGKTALGLRAGFVLSGGVWKMDYLVAGD